MYHCLLFPRKQSSRNLSARRSPQLVPVTTPGGVGSRCQPKPSCALPAASTQHEWGLSSLNRVVSCGSAMEVWALQMRLSHYLRARGAVSAVVPRWRAAWTRWLSVGISEAAAKHCFSLCSTEHPFQIQNLSIFHATQRTGPTTSHLRGNRKRHHFRSRQCPCSCCNCTIARSASRLGALLLQS